MVKGSHQHENPKVNDFFYGYDSDSASGDLTHNTSTTSDLAGHHSSNNGNSGLAEEERWVLISRWLVFTVMVAAATLVGVETFRISTKHQQDSFINDVSFCNTYVRLMLPLFLIQATKSGNLLVSFSTILQLKKS